MSGSDDRVQDALAAHLEHAELGGPEPDVSHLAPDEIAQLNELIHLLADTDGIAFGSGLGARVGAIASSEAGERLVTTLRDALPPGTRIARDPAAETMDVEGMEITEGWIIGTFGGRVRVWLLAGQGALEGSERWLRDLERVFRLYPDTVAIALVEADESCLLVQPEDCAPKIEVPRGALVGRRYRRPVHPVGDALSRFLQELIPYWEPMADISEHTDRTIDAQPIASERATVAIEEQVAAGSRARKTNPKRKALTELSEEHAARLARLLVEVHEGRSGVDAVEDELRRLASER